MFDDKTFNNRESAVSGDEEILAKFREWCEARRPPLPGSSDDEIITLNAQMDEIRDSVLAIPSAGVLGLTIKAYLCCHCELDGYGDGHPEGLPDFNSTGPIYETQRVMQALVRDLPRFVPELASLCAPFLEEEADEQPAGDDDEAGAEVFRDLGFEPTLGMTEVERRAGMAVIQYGSPDYLRRLAAKAKGEPEPGDDASDDPLVGMLAERNRLFAEGDLADRARDEQRRDELDQQAWAIEAEMERTVAVTRAGLLAQLDLFCEYPDARNYKNYIAIIKAGVLALIEREAQP